MLTVYNGSSVLLTKRAGMTTGNWNCMRSSKFKYRRDFYACPVTVTSDTGRRPEPDTPEMECA